MKKVFFDTNFLLRFYLDDIPTQALKAKRMVQAAKKGEILLATDLIVICEMVWIMDSFDNLEKEVISVKITNLYRTPGVVVIVFDITRLKQIQLYWPFALFSSFTPCEDESVVRIP